MDFTKNMSLAFCKVFSFLKRSAYIKTSRRPNDSGQNKERRYAMDNVVSRTLSVHKEHELLLKLEKAGLTDSDAQAIIQSPDNYLAKRIAILARNWDFKPSDSQVAARKIMGKNFFGMEEAMQYFFFNPTLAERESFARVPFSTKDLHALKETHKLIVKLPISAENILQIMGPDMFSFKGRLSEDLTLMRERGPCGWQLIRKTALPDSTERSFKGQSGLLGNDQEMPTIYEMIYMIAAHYLQTKEILFADRAVHTQTIRIRDDEPRHLAIGVFNDEKRWQVYASGEYSCTRLGLAVQKKWHV